MGIRKTCKTAPRFYLFLVFKFHQERFEFKTKNKMGIYYLYKNLNGLTNRTKRGKYRYIL